MPRSQVHNCGPGASAPAHIGLAEAAARHDLELRLAQVPWHIRTPLLETAAALLRYLERTYGDDQLDRLDESGIKRAFVFELSHHLQPPRAYGDFVEDAHALQAFAAQHGWLDYTPRAKTAIISPN